MHIYCSILYTRFLFEFSSIKKLSAVKFLNETKTKQNYNGITGQSLNILKVLAMNGIQTLHFYTKCKNINNRKSMYANYVYFQNYFGFFFSSRAWFYSIFQFDFGNKVAKTRIELTISTNKLQNEIIETK